MRSITVLVGAVVIAGCCAVNTPKQSLPVYKISTGILSVSNEYMIADIQYPVICGIRDPAMHKTVNGIFKADADEMLQEATDITSEVKGRKEDDGYSGNYDFSIEYEVHLALPDLLSITTDNYQYTGGAHGSTYRKSFNIELKTGSNLSIGSVFKHGVDYKAFINKWVEAEIAKEPDTYFEKSYGGFESITDEQQFYLTDSALVVIFQEYEIACGAAGIIEIEIPIAEVREHLAVEL